MADFEKAVERKRWDEVFRRLEPMMIEPPFPADVLACIVALVDEIKRIEADRGEIAGTERSSLAPDAQPYQDLIDRILYRVAGLTDAEARGLEKRLEQML